jgi:DNA-binding MarR family transcriptional regulator
MTSNILIDNPLSLPKPIRRMQDGPWYWIHKEILTKHAKDMKVSTMLVYNALAYFADKYQKSFPSQKYLAGFLDLSRSSIHRAINELEARRLIYVDRSKKSHHYYLLKTDR